MLTLKILWLFSIVLFMGSVSKCKGDNSSDFNPEDGADILKIEYHKDLGDRDLDTTLFMRPSTISAANFENLDVNIQNSQKNLNLAESDLSSHTQSTIQNPDITRYGTDAASIGLDTKIPNVRAIGDEVEEQSETTTVTAIIHLERDIYPVNRKKYDEQGSSLASGNSEHEYKNSIYDAGKPLGSTIIRSGDENGYSDSEKSTTEITAGSTTDIQLTTGRRVSNNESSDLNESPDLYIFASENENRNPDSKIFSETGHTINIHGATEENVNSHEHLASSTDESSRSNTFLSEYKNQTPQFKNSVERSENGNNADIHNTGYATNSEYENHKSASFIDRSFNPVVFYSENENQKPDAKLPAVGAEIGQYLDTLNAREKNLGSNENQYEYENPMAVSETTISVDEYGKTGETVVSSEYKNQKPIFDTDKLSSSIAFLAEGKNRKSYSDAPAAGAETEQDLDIFGTRKKVVASDGNENKELSSDEDKATTENIFPSENENPKLEYTDWASESVTKNNISTVYSKTGETTGKNQHDQPSTIDTNKFSVSSSNIFYIKHNHQKPEFKVAVAGVKIEKNVNTVTENNAGTILGRRGENLNNTEYENQQPTFNVSRLYSSSVLYPVDENQEPEFKVPPAGAKTGQNVDIYGVREKSAASNADDYEKSAPSKYETDTAYIFAFENENQKPESKNPVVGNETEGIVGIHGIIEENTNSNGYEKQGLSAAATNVHSSTLLISENENHLVETKIPKVEAETGKNRDVHGTSDQSVSNYKNEEEKSLTDGEQLSRSTTLPSENKNRESNSKNPVAEINIQGKADIRGSLEKSMGNNNYKHQESVPVTSNPTASSAYRSENENYSLTKEPIAETNFGDHLEVYRTVQESGSKSKYTEQEPEFNEEAPPSAMSSHSEKENQKPESKVSSVEVEIGYNVDNYATTDKSDISENDNSASDMGELFGSTVFHPENESRVSDLPIPTAEVTSTSNCSATKESISSDEHQHQKWRSDIDQPSSSSTFPNGNGNQDLTAKNPLAEDESGANTNIYDATEESVNYNENENQKSVSVVDKPLSSTTLSTADSDNITEYGLSNRKYEGKKRLNNQESPNPKFKEPVRNEVGESMGIHDKLSKNADDDEYENHESSSSVAKLFTSTIFLFENDNEKLEINKPLTERVFRESTNNHNTAEERASNSEHENQKPLLGSELKGQWESISDTNTSSRIVTYEADSAKPVIGSKTEENANVRATLENDAGGTFPEGLDNDPKHISSNNGDPAMELEATNKPDITMEEILDHLSAPEKIEIGSNASVPIPTGKSNTQSSNSGAFENKERETEKSSEEGLSANDQDILVSNEELTADTTDTLDITVEEIFRNSNSDSKIPEPNGNVAELGGILNQWLEEQNEYRSSTEGGIHYLLFNSGSSTVLEKPQNSSLNLNGSLTLERNKLLSNSKGVVAIAQSNFGIHTSSSESDIQGDTDSNDEKSNEKYDDLEKGKEGALFPPEAGNDLEEEPFLTSANKLPVSVALPDEVESSGVVKHTPNSFSTKGIIDAGYSYTNSPSQTEIVYDNRPPNNTHTEAKNGQTLNLFQLKELDENQEEEEVNGKKAHVLNAIHAETSTEANFGVNSIKETHSEIEVAEGTVDVTENQHEWYETHNSSKSDDDLHEAHRFNTEEIITSKELQTGDLSSVTTATYSSDFNANEQWTTMETKSAAAILQSHDNKGDAEDSLPQDSILNLTATGESRMAFLKEPSPHKLDYASSVISAPKQGSENLPYFYGSISNNGGLLCTSLNLTIKLFLNNTLVRLPPTVLIKGNCGMQKTNITFQWYQADDLYDVSITFGVQFQSGFYFVNSINVNIIKYETYGATGEEITAEKENIDLFKTEIGSTFENSTELLVRVEQGIEIYLSDVEFFALYSFTSSEAYGTFVNYQSELIGGSIGLLLVGVAVLYVFKKFSERKDKFKPASV